MRFSFLIALNLFTSLSWAGPQLAITVDDLPIHGEIAPPHTRVEIARRFVDVFRKHHVSEAYGFVNGRKVDDHPETIEVLNLWAKAGHPLANHGFSHLNLDRVSSEAFLDEVRLNETLLERFSAAGSYKWFRYPFLFEGDTRNKRRTVREGLQGMGYRIAQVTVDFEDWSWNDPYARCLAKGDGLAIRRLEDSYLEQALIRLKNAEAASLILFGRPIKHVLLLHIGLFDSLMLDRLLTAYEKAGAELIPLKDAASDPIYEIDPGLTRTAGETFLKQIAASRGAALPSVPRLPLRELELFCGTSSSARLKQETQTDR